MSGASEQATIFDRLCALYPRTVGAFQAMPGGERALAAVERLDERFAAVVRGVEADAIVMAMNHAGQVASAWKHWRRIVAAGQIDITGQLYADLLAAARSKLPDGGRGYVFRSRPQLVYQERDGRLSPIFRFSVDPENPKDREASPPRPSHRNRLRMF